TRGDAVEVALLLFHFTAASFKHERAGDHRVRLESFDLRDGQFLPVALQISEPSPGSRFQCQPELELEIVHQSDAGWRCGLAREVVHELESGFEAPKENRARFVQL